MSISFPRTSIRKFAALTAATSVFAGVFAGATSAPAQAAATTTSTTAAASATVATNSAVLPFDLPSTAALHGSDKQVFAHYVPWYPLSLDNKAASAPDYYNKNYVAANGEKGKYAAHGGLLRDRPFTRAPIATADWKVRDMETEIRQAQAAGIDGFVVSITSFGNTRTYRAVQDLLVAAEKVGNFSIMLRPNMIAAGIKDLGADKFAAEMAVLAKSPAAYRLKDGRLVFSPFMAESDSIPFWQSFLTGMKRRGVNVAFWPMFLNEMTWGAKFTPVTYGETTWGERTATNNDPNKITSTSKLGRIASVKARGKKWMQAVSTGDARPAQHKFFEPHNSENLRSTWAIANKGGAAMVHIPTWNDYAEGTQIAPSAKLGWAQLDLNAYYLTWYKTGVAPKIRRDAIYLSNRSQLSTAKVSYSAVMKPANNAKVYDEAEALVFLKAPGKVTVTAGSRSVTCDAPAGISYCRVPLAVGAVKAAVVRGGKTVSAVTSKATVKASPAVQDMDYVYTSSLRTGSTTAAPVTDTAPAPAPDVTAPVVKALTPNADTYVHEGLPTRNSATNASLGLPR